MCEISGRPIDNVYVKSGWSMSNFQNFEDNVQWCLCKIEIGLYYDTTKFSFTHWIISIEYNFCSFIDFCKSTHRNPYFIWSAIIQNVLWSMLSHTNKTTKDCIQFLDMFLIIIWYSIYFTALIHKAGNSVQFRQLQLYR